MTQYFVMKELGATAGACVSIDVVHCGWVFRTLTTAQIWIAVIMVHPSDRHRIPSQGFACKFFTRIPGVLLSEPPLPFSRWSV